MQLEWKCKQHNYHVLNLQMIKISREAYVKLMKMTAAYN